MHCRAEGQGGGLLGDAELGLQGVAAGQGGGLLGSGLQGGETGLEVLGRGAGLEAGVLGEAGLGLEGGAAGQGLEQLAEGLGHDQGCHMLEAGLELLVGFVGQEILQLAAIWLFRTEGHCITADGRIGYVARGLYYIVLGNSKP